MFLLDTNLWIQQIRERSLADEVASLLAAIPPDRAFVSIYSVHSIGVIMSRHGLIDRFGAFLAASSIGVGIRVVDVAVTDLGRIAAACLALRLDFDDAYQYVAAELNGLRIVSLDADFDRTPRGRLTPAAALQLFKDEQSAPRQGP